MYVPANLGAPEYPDLRTFGWKIGTHRAPQGYQHSWLAVTSMGTWGAFSRADAQKILRFAKGGKGPGKTRKNPRGGLNDREREMWVQNDEGLYNWFRSSRLSMREFLRQNRAEIDAAIKGVLGPQEPSPRMSRRELELHRAKHWTTSMNPARDPYAYRKPRGLPVMSEVAYVYGPKNIIFWRGTGWLNSDQARGIAQWIDANSGYGSDLYNVVIGLRMHFDAVGGLKFKFAREYSPTLYVKIGGGKNRAYWTNKMLQHIHSLRITKADEIDIVSASRKGGPVKWSDGQVIRLWWD